MRIIYDDEISANTTDIQQMDIVPSGSRIYLQRFTAAARGPESVLVALQWGTVSQWETIEFAWLIGSTFDSKVDYEFDTDGTKRFRVVRRTTHTLVGTRQVIAKVEGFVRASS